MAHCMTMEMKWKRAGSRLVTLTGCLPVEGWGDVVVAVIIGSLRHGGMNVRYVIYSSIYSGDR